VLSRRRILTGGGRVSAAALLLAACTSTTGRPPERRSGAALTARPSGSPSGPPPGPGEQPLGLEASRDALLHVPPGLSPERPAGLVVLLHGAGGDAAGGLSLLRPFADARGLLLLAPASRRATWDGVRGRYGPDVEVVDRALDRVFGSIAVDPDRIAIGGFSDGASYALGLGLANGDLFGHVVAFSPGFVPPAPRVGEPAVFVSHGDDDAVLPIGSTSRRIVPALREDGYRVTYEEFDGPHTVPLAVAEAAVDWLGW
jgi:predicted esterase